MHRGHAGHLYPQKNGYTRTCNTHLRLESHPISQTIRLKSDAERPGLFQCQQRIHMRQTDEHCESIEMFWPLTEAAGESPGYLQTPGSV